MQSSAKLVSLQSLQLVAIVRVEFAIILCMGNLIIKKYLDISYKLLVFVFIFNLYFKFNR